MAFYGDVFIFDDIPCTEFGLMIYSFGSNSQSDTAFKNGSLSEDRIATRHDALTYGLVQNDSLEYTLIFGANPDSIDAYSHIDRYEVEAIASWLTGHSTRKWLTIVQQDMGVFRYKCFISDMTLITYGDLPWAFSCKVNCDSPFAYTAPEEFEYKVTDGEMVVNLFNRSSRHGYYYPKMEITMDAGDELSIINASDNNREFKFKEVSYSKPLTIAMDNQNQIITNDLDLNFYKHLDGMKFMRLVRGDNILRIKGTGTVKFICEFPVNIGG